MMLGNETSLTQRLMFPEVLAFSTDDVALLRERYDDFITLGFEYSVRDNNSIEVTGIPADFNVDEIHDLLYDMIDAVCDETQYVEDRRERLAGVLSRSGARRTPESYSEGEIAAIMETIASGGRYEYTSDGRPVFLRLGAVELKRLFKR